MSREISLEQIDNLNVLISNLSGVINCLSADQHYEVVSDEIMGNCLFAAGGFLKEIQSFAQSLALCGDDSVADKDCPSETELVVKEALVELKGTTVLLESFMREHIKPATA